MKTNATILASAMLLAIVVIAALQSPASGQHGSDARQSYQGGLQNGRFLLYQGQYEVTNRLPGKNGEHDKSPAAGLFKIDTANGRVWKYDESVGAANSVRQGWTEIDNR